MRTLRAALLAALVVAAAGCYGGYVEAGYTWPYGYSYSPYYHGYGGYAYRYSPYRYYGYGYGPYRGYYAPYRGYYGYYSPYRGVPYRGTTVRPYYGTHPYGGRGYYAPRGYYGYGSVPPHHRR